MQRLNWVAAGSFLALTAATCFTQEQYPKPLVHTASDHPAARLLLLSIDGLHAFDLANWVAAHPHSALAELTARGVTYTNAHTPASDPAAGLLALVTGGTPISTGIISSNGYDRELSPAGSACRSVGASIDFSRAGHLKTIALDPREGCKPLAPHDLLRVNTMFEVVREKIGPTAWAGEDAATTDLLRGPSGNGLGEACVDATGDAARVDLLLHCIGSANVPSLFGMSFSSVAQAQAAGGYMDELGTPSPELQKSMQMVDDSVGRIITELKRKELFDTTWIAIASPYGQSPLDRRQRRFIPLSQIRQVLEATMPGSVAHLSGGDVAMIWLRDSGNDGRAAKLLSEAAARLEIQDVFWGDRLTLTLNSPAKDSRMPDIILQPRAGVVWGERDNALMVHGGMLEDDTHVALLISGVQLTGRSDPTYVPTTQLAPLLLRALGMEKFDLRALHVEHSPALPGIF